MPSADFKTKLNAVNADERPLILLEIYHDDLPEPVRVVNDTQDVTSNGNTYIAMAFAITLPDQQEEGIPRATLTIDNVGKMITDVIEETNGASGASVRIMMVLRSNPNVIEYDITLSMVSVTITQKTVTANLGYEDIMNRKTFNVLYTPASHPGLY